MPDLLLQHICLGNGDRVDIAIDGGRFTGIHAAGAAPKGAGTSFNGRDYVALPPFVDAHLHLDKTLWDQPWISNNGEPTRQHRIAREEQVLKAHPASIATRANALIDHLVARGTGWFRSHVDVTPAYGLQHAEAMLELRAGRGMIDSLQLVAFPQAGLLSKPGTLDLMRAALGLGFDVIGGIDPAGFDNDPMGQLRLLFDLADKTGKPIDIHLHDDGELGAWEIDRIADLTAAHGMVGRVMISHAYCLGAITETHLARIADRLARLEISLMTAAPAWTSAPPVAELRALGVNICCGSDGIRDVWSPFGSGDMIERSMLMAERFGWATDAELRIALDCITQGGAKALAIPDYGIAIGHPAHLLLIEAERPEAIPTRINAERIVIRNGAFLHPADQQ